MGKNREKDRTEVEVKLEAPEDDSSQTASSSRPRIPTSEPSSCASQEPKIEGQVQRDDEDDDLSLPSSLSLHVPEWAMTPPPPPVSATAQGETQQHQWGRDPSRGMALPGAAQSAQTPMLDQAFIFDDALVREPSGTSIVEEDSILDFENGRTYNRAGYIVPNDPAEQDRMDFQYAAFSHLLRGRLSFAPMVQPPQHALDVCAGTGIWAIDFAELYPSTQVVGVDIASIQPRPPVPNVDFVKDDATSKWIYSHKFDYVHLRLVYLNFADPKLVMRQAYENMNPGGWIEYQDTYGQVKSANGEVGPAVARWCDLAFNGARMLLGHELDVAQHYKEWLTEVGFVDVKEIKLKWPCNPWPQNPALKRVGHFSLRNYIDGALGVTYKLLRSAGLSIREVDVLVSDAKRELSDTRRHLYTDVWIVYGRKPFQWEREGWFPEPR